MTLSLKLVVLLSFEAYLKLKEPYKYRQNSSVMGNRLFFVKIKIINTNLKIIHQNAIYSNSNEQKHTQRNVLFFLFFFGLHFWVFSGSYYFKLINITAGSRHAKMNSRFAKSCVSTVRSVSHTGLSKKSPKVNVSTVRPTARDNVCFDRLAVGYDCDFSNCHVVIVDHHGDGSLWDRRMPESTWLISEKQ